MSFLSALFRSSAPASPSATAARGGPWLQLLLATRPKQWIKNLIIFLPLGFSLNLYFEPLTPSVVTDLLFRTGLAFVVFCLVSGAVYLFNDLLDMEADREHPLKRYRPLPSGRLSPGVAVVGAVVLLVGGLTAAFALEPLLGVVTAAYALLNVAYSLRIKHMVILDVFALAAGYLLRTVAGAVVIDVPISPWLYTCTILGALFIGLGKRRHEVLLLEGDASNHRRSLGQYTPALLDNMIAVVTPSTVIAYSLYTFSAENLPQNYAMMLTIPFVLYGVFRYLFLVHARDQGGSPEDALLNDMPLMACIFLWALTSVGILLLYRGA